jgi:O-antigen/teichoic acid export membrane protein
MTGTSTARRRGLTAAAVRTVRDGGSALLMGQLVAGVVAFAVNILAARALAPQGRGELALLLQIAYLTSLGLLLGCDRSLVTVYAGRPAATVTRACAALLRRPSTLGLAAAVLLLAVPAGAAGIRWGLALAVLFAVVNAFVRGVRSVAIAAGRYRDFATYTLTSQGLLLLVIGALYLLRVDGVVVWLAGYLVTGAVPTAVWLARWVRSGRDSAGNPDGSDGSGDRAELRRARREGVQLLPAAVANTGMLRLDRLILPALASAAALGTYASVSTMTELIAWPLLALADSRLGVWRAAHERGELTLRRFLALATGYALAAAVLGGAVIRYLLVPLLGPAYADAGRLVPPLVLAAAALGVAQLLISAITAVRRNVLASGIEIAGFGTSVVGYVLLIPPLGAMGAAYGSLIGYGTGLLAAASTLAWLRRTPVPAPVRRG